MKLLYVVCLILNVQYGLSVDREVAKILEYEFQNDGTGPYYYKYLTSDGQSREEKSTVEDAGTDQQSLVIRGSYSYTGPDGIVYTVRYTADHNGFHPEGDHINVPPYISWPKNHQHDDQHDHNLLPQNDHVVQIKPTRPPPPPPPPPQSDEVPTVTPQYLPSTPIRPAVTRPPSVSFDGYPTTQYLPSSNRPQQPQLPSGSQNRPNPQVNNDEDNAYYYSTPKPTPQQPVRRPSGSNVFDSQKVRPNPQVNNDEDNAYYYSTPKPTPYLSSTYLPSTRSYRQEASELHAVVQPKDASRSKSVGRPTERKASSGDVGRRKTSNYQQSSEDKETVAKVLPLFQLV